MVYLKFGVGDAVLICAAAMMFGLCVAVAAPWWAYLVGLLASVVAFYGGRLSTKNR